MPGEIRCVVSSWARANARRNQVRRFVVGEGDHSKEVAAEQYWCGFRDELGNPAKRQVGFAARCAVNAVAAFEFVIVVVLRLFALVAGFAFLVAGERPVGNFVPCFVDHHSAYVVWILGEFAEQHQTFAAVRALPDVQDFCSAGNFTDGVSGRNFCHAAFVVLRNLDDFFECGREVAQVTLVLAFNRATGRVNREIIGFGAGERRILGIVFFGDFADIGEDGMCVAGFWRRQKEGIASHAAAKVVYDGGAFTTVLVRLASAFPKRSFPASDILRGALFQR